MKNKICWVVTNGTAGTVSQALGLARAVGFKEIEQKIFKTNFSFSLIPSLSHIFLKSFLSQDSDELEGPWPSVIIGCGRRVIPFLLYIKKITKGKTYCIYIQDPRVSHKYFDLIIKMQHDSITGNNVITSDFSLNMVSTKVLQQGIQEYKKEFTNMPKPYFIILIGGNTKRYQMSNEAIEDLFNKIKRIIAICPGSVLITTSRRTPDFLVNKLIKNFIEKENIYITNPNLTDHNPYFAMLGLAEKIFVTNDSVNMISESCACKKSVYILELLSISLGKTEKFLQTLYRKKLVKIFKNDFLEDCNQHKINNNLLIADKVRDVLLKNRICTKSDFLKSTGALN